MLVAEQDGGVVRPDRRDARAEGGTCPAPEARQSLQGYSMMMPGTGGVNSFRLQR
jgi:hypothetical protein